MKKKEKQGKLTKRDLNFLAKFLKKQLVEFTDNTMKRFEEYMPDRKLELIRLKRMTNYLAKIIANEKYLKKRISELEERIIDLEHERWQN